MNKSQLVKIISAKTETSANTVDNMLAAFTETVTETLAAGHAVQIVGFGTFETRKRAARTGINPQTKEPIEIPGCMVPHFKPGKSLKEAVKDEK